MTEEVRARVEMIDGVPHLIDPDAVAMMRAVAKHNCRNTFNANAERIAHFHQRMLDLGRTPSDVVIVVANVNDEQGGILADALMPDFDWSIIRARGEIPFARGLAAREGVQGFLNLIDEEAGKKLLEWTTLAVVVVDHGVAEVFSV